MIFDILRKNFNVYNKSATRGGFSQKHDDANA